MALFLHLNYRHLKIKNLSLCFPIDSKLAVKIVEFDKENKKIVLSALAAMKDKTEAEIEEYINEHKLEKVTVEDIRSADSGKFDASVFVGFDETAGKSENKKNEKVEKKTEEVKEEVVEEKVEEKVEEEANVEEPKVEEEPKTEEAAVNEEEKVEEETEELLKRS